MKKIPLILVIASFALAACSRGNTTNSPTSFEISDPAKILSAAAGSEFKIVIESNQSTGYHWDLVDELDESAVQFVSNEFKGGEPAMTGSGGVEVWTFKAVSPGETQITLGYYPPSNEPTKPQQTVTFTVKIK
jgi:predicted secreted protein